MRDTRRDACRDGDLVRRGERGRGVRDREGGEGSRGDEPPVEPRRQTRELSTRMVKVVLDLEADCRAIRPPSCTRALAEELAAELQALDDRLACLTKSRDAVALYLGRSAHADLLAH
ncbi:hypothetical protein AB0P19_10290 [Microbacterium oleivorans]|uniref:hypothetical protein n=1 Tax=Microbacterium oleivorans TaxID=273677 RepID=UPI0033FC2F5B